MSLSTVTALFDDPVFRKRLAGGIGGGALAWWLNSKYFIASDVKQVIKMLKVKKAIDFHMANNHTIADVWEESHTQYAKKAAFIFEGKTYTFDDIEKLSNKIANWLKTKGVKKGDVVALFMENCPEYVAIWLGMLKVGAIGALINFNLTKKPLVHSITVSRAKMCIVDAGLADSIRAVRDQLTGIELFSFGGNVDFAPSVEQQLTVVSDKRPPRQVRDGCKFTDPALLVYTSGTTGLPKAATIKHVRMFSMGFGFTRLFDVTSDDRIMCVLPLYHSAGGLVGVGMTICSGATMILKKKFSATSFFKECRDQKVTVMQYIGELCRYLLTAPESEADSKNSIRIAIGNGLRPDIWAKFQKRFNIKEIGEFYGSTEGNAALFNHCVEPKAQGAVGRMGPLLRKASKVHLVRFDVTKEEPIRDANGFCIPCKPGEVGELLGEIDEKDPLRQFAGYFNNDKGTKSKILTDAFRKGDKFFRTGDLLRHEPNGFWYFVDRIGDTFRWKGENVSTTEVAEVVSVFPGVDEVNVYGVSVPGKDGRACMAAMVWKNDLDFAKLAKHCIDNLPSYAVPLFIRRLPVVEITGTFKHQKVELRNQGCDPAQTKSGDQTDAVYMFDADKKTYVPLNDKLYQEALVMGRAKL